ncbi:MAG: T9SS type A sorting domain-containing protein [Saprospiraceae bacterium]|nr:T9SS type A sorting domain-containing protein [Saprospiraceae bacterium]
MRQYTSTAFLCLLFCLFWSCQSDRMPAPTNGHTLVKEGEEGSNADKRNQWLLDMHRAAPEDNWLQEEYLNQIAQAQQSSLDWRSGCDVVTLAGDKLRGEWQERGSQNQAGSVIDTEYDPVTDEIWLISAGGTLWKGKSDGSRWEVVNQEHVFSEGALHFVTNRAERRLVALINKEIHYSDDQGQSWNRANGIPNRDDYWGGAENVVVLEGLAPIIFFIGKRSYWDNISLYRSTDAGVSFQKLRTFETHLPEAVHLNHPHHSESVFLVDNSEGEPKYSEYTSSSGNFTLLETGESFSFGDQRVNLDGWAQGDSLRLYSFGENEGGDLGVFLSTDRAQSWSYQGPLPKEPWAVGMYVSPENPEVLMMGEVECYRSVNAGKTWSRINRWGDYYSDVEHKLHADIMYFAEYRKADDTPFLLVSNHGGLSISYDYYETQQNIGLSGLNVSQYYSVVTDPLDPNFVYAGSQDQGFQRSPSFEDAEAGSEYFDQIISGDYGHLTFSKGGQSLWVVYPEGWITQYAKPQEQGYNASYQLPEGQRSGLWMPPLMASPNPEEDAIYMAGGSLENDEGSYLIKLTAEGTRIEAETGDFNFRLESGDGEISALATAPSNPDHWYVATNNGRFFFSKDAGETWEQSLNFIVQGQFFYGQAIHVSQLNENVVYLGGSGYSNSAVFVSKDGGENFVALNQGLPNTLVLGLAADPAEQFLFAATEAGPYVYIQEEERWYPIRANCAPNHTYWSVEYIPSLGTARFGTYGRGIWDFTLDPMVNTQEELAVQAELKVFPNPTRDWVQISISSEIIQSTDLQLRLFAANGQLIRQLEVRDVNTRLDLQPLTPGTYWVELTDGQRRSTRSIILAD